jgi:uncharacterized membrane protein YwzB
MNDRGFASLTLVITVSSIILAFSALQSLDIAQFFDQTRTKQYRLMNYYNAYSCIDQAILNLSHNYFYRISTSTPISYLDCSIEEVVELNGLIQISSVGNYRNINVKRVATVKLNDFGIEVIKK